MFRPQFLSGLFFSDASCHSRNVDTRNRNRDKPLSSVFIVLFPVVSMVTVVTAMSQRRNMRSHWMWCGSYLINFMGGGIPPTVLTLPAGMIQTSCGGVSTSKDDEPAWNDRGSSCRDVISGGVVTSLPTARNTLLPANASTRGSLCAQHVQKYVDTQTWHLPTPLLQSPDLLLGSAPRTRATVTSCCCCSWIRSMNEFLFSDCN